MKALVRSATQPIVLGRLACAVFVLAALTWSAAAAAAAPTGAEDLAALHVDDAGIRFSANVSADRWELQVTGVSGVVLRREVSTDELDELLIPRLGDGSLQPGRYTYALYAVRHGAGRQVQAGGFTVTASGVSVVAGESVSIAGLAEMLGAGLAAASAAPAFDFVINDDLVVDGSTCIGFDCVNNVVFGYTTLGLVENNLRITFWDTSSAASYPRNDWRLEANASTNGGSNHFAIVDCGTNANLDSCPTNRRVFLVEAGAPVDALRVDSGGRLGLGTANPVLEIHTRNNDTPALRLEQDSSSGWTPQTWDVAGNETNFFVRDATNGSTLPFRIRPGAPSNMIFIDGDGVAMGHSSPAAQLDVKSGAAGRVALSVDTAASPTASPVAVKVNGSSRLEFVVGGNTVEAMRAHQVDNGTGAGPYVFLRRNSNASTPAAGSVVLEAVTGLYSIWVDGSANLRIANQLGVTNATDTAGTVVGTQTSWFEAKTDVSPWDSRGALERVVDLPLFAYRFREDSQRGDKINHGLVVFETDRDAWWVMNSAANQTPVLDEANLFGYLIGAIKELDAELAERDRAVNELAQRVEALEAALQRVLAGSDGSR